MPHGYMATPQTVYFPTNGIETKAGETVNSGLPPQTTNEKVAIWGRRLEEKKEKAMSGRLRFAPDTACSSQRTTLSSKPLQPRSLVIEPLFSYLGNLPYQSVGPEGHNATMPDTALSHDDANENKGPVILAIVWALTLTAGLFVGLRLAVRVHKFHRLRADDGIIVVSQVIVKPRTRVVQDTQVVFWKCCYSCLRPL